MNIRREETGAQGIQSEDLQREDIQSEDLGEVRSLSSG